MVFASSNSKPRKGSHGGITSSSEVTKKSVHLASSQLKAHSGPSNIVWYFIITCFLATKFRILLTWKKPERIKEQLSFSIPNPIFHISGYLLFCSSTWLPSIVKSQISDKRTSLNENRSFYGQFHRCRMLCSPIEKLLPPWILNQWVLYFSLFPPWILNQ